MSRFSPKRYSVSREDSPTSQEHRVASRLGGKRVRGSGASQYSKGDVRDVEFGDVKFLVEAKQTERASISIKWDWLKKISREAEDQSCEPMLTIEIKGGDNDSLADRDWAMVPVRVLERLKG